MFSSRRLLKGLSVDILSGKVKTQGLSSELTFMKKQSPLSKRIQEISR
jgi:hypothetical protein